MTAKRAGVLIVDDHPMVRVGIAKMLEGAGLRIAGEAGSLEEGLRHPQLDSSSVVIVDLALGDGNGLELIQAVCAKGGRVLVYSMHEDAGIIRRALVAGAFGYVTKREVFGSLLEGIEAVANGARFLSPRVHEALSDPAPLEALTGQQERIFEMMGCGMSNAAIAVELGISVRTLESYCVRMMNKFGFNSIKDLRGSAIREAAKRLPGS